MSCSSCLRVMRFEVSDSDDRSCWASLSHSFWKRCRLSGVSDWRAVEDNDTEGQSVKEARDRGDDIDDAKKIMMVTTPMTMMMKKKIMMMMMMMMMMMIGYCWWWKK